MAIVNEITIKIIRNARDGESIYSLANKIGFAYSAVYRWILELEKYEVVKIIRKGNKRPLVYIISKKKFAIEKLNKLPVMPLKELVEYCSKLYLDNVLEQLDLLYNLGIN